MAEPADLTAGDASFAEALALTQEDPSRWYSTNSFGLPTALLASAAFNAHPCRLRIHGTRETHGGLFRLLESCTTQQQAADVFSHYMTLQFSLDHPSTDGRERPSRPAVCYLDLLRGWAVDSNGMPAAVLKGWVESRFGLIPAFHKERLGRFPSPAWIAYIEEKNHQRFHDHCINLQLDLLYEFCQWSLRRFRWPTARLVRLWRGSNDCAAQLVAGSLSDERCILRLNNLVSFSDARARAEEFGDWVIEADVPAVKLLFFPELLNGRILTSEREYLVVGGCYPVRLLRNGERFLPVQAPR